MDLQHRLTGFAVLSATWIAWVLVGLSMGGVAVALQRVIYLISTSRNMGKLKAQIRGLLRPGDLYLPVRCPVDCRP
ncbi:MAG TPA: hypothetical protein VFH68_08985 [Polyangia bacterium]|jgi:hypothetical protein|nr:hypothetical protein [Polyangia bacterium]